ncbi:MAG: hypothetical protein ACI4FV_08915 [Lachnospiraceae bacterium]
MKKSILQYQKQISVILIVFSIFASVKMLFFAYGLDEEYQLVMSYRSAMGERLFFSMWEPHQSSAFLCSLFMKPYLHLVGTTGIVLYLRLVGTLIHLAVSVYFYHVMKEIIKPGYAWLLALIYYNTIPKQIMMPEFGIMQVWFFTLMMLFLLQYYRKEKPIKYLILAAISLVFEVLSYPSCLILYPFVLVVLYKRSGNTKWKDMGILTAVCGGCGIGYLGMLLRGRSLSELLDTIALILAGDVTHGASIFQKLLSVAGNLLYLGSLTALVIAIALLVERLLKKRLEKRRKDSGFAGDNLDEADDADDTIDFQKKKTVCRVCLAVLFACVLEVIYWTVLNQGYETMQIHLVVITVVGLAGYGKIRKKEVVQTSRILVDGIIGSGISLIAVVYLTDLTLIDSLPHAMLAAFFAVVLFLQQTETVDCDNKKTSKTWIYLMLVVWCLTAIFGKGYTLRSGTSYNNVLESGGILKYGPAMGTISNYMGAYVYNCDYEDWQTYLQDGDRVLVVVDQVMNLGTTQYLFKDVTISHFSIVNPTAYDERLIDYWKMFPEKEPNVIIVDCWYGELMTDPDSYIMKYIENDFGYTQVNDGRYIRIYRK